MPDRFIFRQVHWSDLQTFLKDGELRARNHPMLQKCHQVSLKNIIELRDNFNMPGGTCVNDYVPFYFSPFTGYTYTIFKENIKLMSPEGKYLRKACEDDRIFLVGRPENFINSSLIYYFSDYGLNSRAPIPSLSKNLDELESHVHWSLFDENPKTAKIPEIGYLGVQKFFLDMDTPPERMNRKAKRSAEFLVHNNVPLIYIDYIIVKTDDMVDKIQEMLGASAWDIPVHSNPGCFWE